MRRAILVPLVVAIAACLSMAVLINALDSTLLNGEYIAAKMEEQGLYEEIIGSFEVPGDASGMSVDIFVEVVGMEKAKEMLNGMISSLLVYLKDPAVDTIEFGLPGGLFGDEATISINQVLPEEELSFLRDLKGFVQLLLLGRSIALIVSLGCLAIVVIVAKGVRDKAKWLGYSFLSAGAVILLLSFIAQSAITGMLDSGPLSGEGIGNAFGSLLKSIAGDFSSSAQSYGFGLLVLGIILFAVSVFLVPRLLIKKGKVKLAEKEPAKKE